MPLTLYRRRKGGNWHARGTVDGHRLRFSTGTTDKARAQQIVGDREARQWKVKTDGPQSVVTFAMAVALYQRAGRPTRRFVLPMLDYWKDTLIKDITPGRIRQAAAELYPVEPDAPNSRNATRNRQVIVPTQAIINHAAESELCQPIRVKRFPVETTEKKPVSWAWVEAFQSAASPHLGALASFMFLTGARISEALSLTWQDVELGSARALVRQTKIGAERWAHLPPPLVLAIANIPGPREGKVFRYSSRDTAKPPWRNACKRAGIEQLSFHACRHGFATGLLDQGVSPITVAERGGWKDARHVFETYGHDVASDRVTDLLTDTDGPAHQAAEARQGEDEMKVSDGLGIIRHAPGTGSSPQMDRTHFDGWYYGDWGHKAAKEIYADWRKRYPGWVVALVKAMDIDFGEAMPLARKGEEK